MAARAVHFTFDEKDGSFDFQWPDGAQLHVSAYDVGRAAHCAICWKVLSPLKNPPSHSLLMRSSHTSTPGLLQSSQTLLSFKQALKSSTGVWRCTHSSLPPLGAGVICDSSFLSMHVVHRKIGSDGISTPIMETSPAVVFFAPDNQLLEVWWGLEGHSCMMVCSLR